VNSIINRYPLVMDRVLSPVSAGSPLVLVGEIPDQVRDDSPFPRSIWGTIDVSVHRESNALNNPENIKLLGVPRQSRFTLRTNMKQLVSQLAWPTEFSNR
jgi:hypothetical protein